ncbi:6-phosphogluconolactonase [Nesterenkonia ebinurensis]|uniref:6-phosphogluconolactonase n=1 Tax=Nesterenkonia ebinurensis TaxID=2608252 RepID=UPI00123DBF35|nr:6-phosphogluconolactonase [Nesterenkonia ebinurensis]
MGVQINAETAEPQVEIFADRPAVTHTIAARLLAVLKEAVDTQGIAHVSLTGGGAGIATLEAMAELVRKGAEAPDWASVHFWWGDERLLPAGDEDRNETQARAALLDFLVAEQGLPAENICAMPTSEEAAHPEAGAQIYARQLETHAPEHGIAGPHGKLMMPRFDVMLLGVGPDGHVNSLFPGKDSLNVTGQATTGESDAPAALGPPLRVTLTFDAVHTARRVWTGVTGADKAEAAAAALTPGADVAQYPAANARGSEETIWHLDKPAAANLS